MATEVDRFVSDELPAVREHFDNQLSTIRSLVESAKAQMEANHHTQVAQMSGLGRDISEVKADVKAQNSRVGKLEVEVAYMKGQRSGGSAMYTALLAALGALLGAVGAAVTLTQIGG